MDAALRNHNIRHAFDVGLTCQTIYVDKRDGRYSLFEYKVTMAEDLSQARQTAAATADTELMSMIGSCRAKLGTCTRRMDEI